jgi:Na+-driven multidrug efflux pump
MSMIAIPSIFQQSFVSVGIFFVQNLVNGLGSDTVAGFSAAMKVSTAALLIMSALPNALSSYSAQNIGAGDVRRVREGTRIAILVSLGVVIAFIGLFFFFGENVLELFLGSHATDGVIKPGIQYLLTVMAFYPLIAIKNCCDSDLRGGGAMMPFMITTFSDLFLRVILAYIMTPIIGYTGICLAYPIGWALGTILSVIFYHSNVWIPKYLRAADGAKKEHTGLRKLRHI